MKKAQIGMAVAIGCFASTAFAASKYQNESADPASIIAKLPPELLVDGKPMDPYCFAEMEGDSSRFDPIDVTDCHRISTKYEDKGLAQIIPEAWKYNKNGSIGYGYRFKDDDYTNAYVNYKYLGKLKSLPAVLIYSGGGGSGHFSSIITVERSGNVIKLKNQFNGGDRCTGGIVSASVSDGKLIYDQSITPGVFIVLSGQMNKNDYDKQLAELADVPPACYGIAHYENEKLKFVELAPGDHLGFTKSEKAPDGHYHARLMTPEEFTANYKGDKEDPQGCFDRLFFDYLTHGKTKLGVDELKIFADKFVATCIKH